MTSPTFSRRRFNRFLLGLGAAGLVEAPVLASAMPKSETRLFRAVYGEPTRTGRWRAAQIDGAVPRDLRGTLYRIAPGQMQNHGVQLKHLFDGDAFAASYTFEDGAVNIHARYINTPEREHEQREGKMIYSEFGTLPPDALAEGRMAQNKNQPNVNLIHYDGQLLGLSEGGPPAAIDPETLAFKGWHRFKDTLPSNVPFTAHPRFDPVTGEGYGFGVSQDQFTALTVYRMNQDGRLTQLHRVPLPGYMMIHDMAITDDFLVFVIPPVRFDFAKLFSSVASIAQAMKFAADEPLRILVMRRDGTGKPHEFKLPGAMVFHHGNAYQEGERIVLETFLSEDDAILKALLAIDKDVIPQVAPTYYTQLNLDLASGMVKRKDRDRGHEFPRFDERLTGKSARYLYTLAEIPDRHDPLVSNRLVRSDLKTGALQHVDAPKGHALEEAVFVPRGAGEDEGWLLLRGYAADRGQTYLDIRDAATLERAARIWHGASLPLGFHGNWHAAI